MSWTSSRVQNNYASLQWCKSKIACSSTGLTWLSFFLIFVPERIHKKPFSCAQRRITLLAVCFWSCIVWLEFAARPEEPAEALNKNVDNSSEEVTKYMFLTLPLELMVLQYPLHESASEKQYYLNSSCLYFNCYRIPEFQTAEKTTAVQRNCDNVHLIVYTHGIIEQNQLGCMCNLKSQSKNIKLPLMRSFEYIGCVLLSVCASVSVSLSQMKGKGECSLHRGCSWFWLRQGRRCYSRIIRQEIRVPTEIAC